MTTSECSVGISWLLSIFLARVALSSLRIAHLPDRNLRLSTTRLLSRQVPEPLQRPQPRHEAVFASSRDHEARQTLQSLAKRPLGNIECAVTVGCSAYRVPTRTPAKERAIVHPFRLHKFELTSEMSAHEREHQPAVHVIILQNSFR